MNIPNKFKIFLLPIIFFITFIGLIYFIFLQKPTDIKIVYEQTFETLQPFNYSDFNSSPLNYIYETLITFDENLTLKPGLAISYGRIQPDLIEIKIKKNVKFHNGETLSSRVIKESFEKIKSETNLKNILENFQNIEIIDDQTFRIQLFNPDPLVFSKLALIPVAKFNQISDLESKPNGTGYYKFDEKKENEIILTLNPNYHSNLPDFKTLTLVSIPDFSDRIQYANLTSNVVASYGVSPEIEILNFDKFELKNYSDQSTNFLIFNNNSPKISKNKDILRKIFKAIDFEILTSGLGKNTDQYLANGVFGYNPKIKHELLSLKDIKTDPSLNYLKTQKLQMGIPKPFVKFSKFLEELFFTLDLNIQITPLDFNDYNKTNLQQYDFYMFGFKADFADGFSFYNSMLKSDSKLNFGNFSNQVVDKQISELKDLESEVDRLKQIQEISNNVSDYGIPLFENQVYFALSKDFSLTPRLDGLIDIKFLKAK